MKPLTLNATAPAKMKPASSKVKPASAEMQPVFPVVATTLSHSIKVSVQGQTPKV